MRPVEEDSLTETDDEEQEVIPPRRGKAKAERAHEAPKCKREKRATSGGEKRGVKGGTRSKR